MPEFATSVVVTRSNDVGRDATAQSSGISRLSAITHQSPSLCASIMTALPHTSSAIHTHGDQDTIIYALQGRGSLVFEGGERSVVLEKGDFAIVPRRVEHREVNESDEEVVWVITRSGASPIVENLDGWGGERV